MHLWTKLYVHFKCQLVGQDSYGNRYFEEKKISRGLYKRRFVIFKNNPEASLVPKLWHSWLHHSTDVIPEINASNQFTSQSKSHLPNLTGTVFAVTPYPSKKNSDTNPDYSAWNPE
jgi:NADH:ubiquinone oxidoreductase subunit